MKSFKVEEFNGPLKEVDVATPQPTGMQVLLKVKPPMPAKCCPPS